LLHPDEAYVAAFHHHRSNSRRDAPTDWIRCRSWRSHLLFVWQFPHFYAIAWMYREEYSKAGILMLPVVEPDGNSTANRILWTSILMVPTSLLPALLAMSGKVYLATAIVMGALLLYTAWKMFKDRSRENARGVLLASVVYLPVLYAVLIFAPR
jgi:protoheme IX farnesyltransferase